MIRHNAGVDNKVHDALSRRVSLLVSLQSEIIGIKCLKDLYKGDENFAEIWEKYSSRQPVQDFHILDEFFLKGSRLCVLRTSLRQKLLGTCTELDLQNILGTTRQ